MSLGVRKVLCSFDRLKSAAINITFLSISDKVLDKLTATNDFPSPATSDVIQMILLFFSAARKFKLVRTDRTDSANTDFGLLIANICELYSSISPGYFLITPIIGMVVRLSMVSLSYM